MTWGVCRAAWKGVPNSEEKDVIGDSVPLVKMMARARDDKSPKATAVWYLRVRKKKADSVSMSMRLCV